MLWAAVLALGLGLSTGKLYDNSGTCSQECEGVRVHETRQCRELPIDDAARFFCPCMAGYFNVAEQCDEECDDAHWSLFTYGTCVAGDEENDGVCGMSCGTRVRVWTTVFIFVLFTAAVVILIFILPMCIASCQACLTAKKERKTRKKQQAADAGVYGGSYDGRTEVAKTQPAQPYNPYMYWPQSYYQTR